MPTPIGRRTPSGHIHDYSNGNFHRWTFSINLAKWPVTPVSPLVAISHVNELGGLTSYRFYSAKFRIATTREVDWHQSWHRFEFQSSARIFCFLCFCVSVCLCLWHSDSELCGIAVLTGSHTFNTRGRHVGATRLECCQIHVYTIFQYLPKFLMFRIMQGHNMNNFWAIAYEHRCCSKLCDQLSVEKSLHDIAKYFQH